MPKLTFQPGLQFECDYTMIFNPFDHSPQAEIARFVKLDWKFSGSNYLYVIANVF